MKLNFQKIKKGEEEEDITAWKGGHVPSIKTSRNVPSGVVSLRGHLLGPQYARAAHEPKRLIVCVANFGREAKQNFCEKVVCVEWRS